MAGALYSNLIGKSYPIKELFINNNLELISLSCCYGGDAVLNAVVVMLAGNFLFEGLAHSRTELRTLTFGIFEPGILTQAVLVIDPASAISMDSLVAMMGLQHDF